MIIFLGGHKNIYINIYNRKVKNKYEKNYKENAGKKSSTSL